MGRNVDRRRRWWGGFFLLLALALLVSGETVLRDRLSTLGLLAFWLLCFLFTCLAVLIAFLDVSATRRRLQDEQRALFEQTLRDINARRQAKPASRPETTE
jgi:hypothetical protein